MQLCWHTSRSSHASTHYTRSQVVYVILSQHQSAKDVPNEKLILWLWQRGEMLQIRWDEYRSLELRASFDGSPRQRDQLLAEDTFLQFGVTVRCFWRWLKDEGEMRILWITRRIEIIFMMIGITELKQFHETLVQTLNILSSPIQQHLKRNRAAERSEFTVEIGDTELLAIVVH